EVAVKTLRSDATDEAAPRLLREAWITGALEHPNIVPVHDLGSDERGRPLLVLKRIEGEPWHPKSRDLEDNLATLMQVCHAIAFAHSRGIVHRDLKPDNIMIGRFGEVYVLDWGIAVATKDDGSGRLPLAAESREVAGTLAYMAPEMLGGAAVTEQTDVFLLGAILYEIIEGRPPHLLESIGASITSIALCEPSLSPDVPAELVAICRRAMAREAAQRYQTADELRLAVAAFLERRTSAQIAHESHEKLRELETQLAAKDATRVTMYQLFGQCRFGFLAALRAWPENPEAREGLDRALAAMATHELDHGDARAAAVLIAELSTPRPALADRLATVERDATEKRKRLERFELDQDVQAGQLTRSFFLTLLGILWSAIPLAGNVIDHVSHAQSFGAPITMLVGIVVFGWWARDSMTKTALNRGVLMTVFIGVVLHAAVEAIAWAGGLELWQTHLLALAMWTGASAVGSVFLDRAMLAPVVVFVGTMLVTVLAPAHRYWAMSVACLSMFSTAIYVTIRERRGRRVYGIADVLRRND
ncbi:MAG TPA: serine/threonine-protein kinase, partial [Kofleriaceae bacterium]|nr:serine/threonine-protein kinase [Kofleriaceae bacterium]